jgi:hypothetical protein
MKPEEILAQTYLNSLGYGVAKYEPDGNVPPDFLLDPSIAVEVRRLNKQIDVGGKREGIEQAEVSLARAVEKTLLKFNSQFSGKTYFVWYRYRRPLSSIKALSKRLESVLQQFLQNSGPTPMEFNIDPSFDIKIVWARPRQGRCFVVAGNSDRERGGWIVDDMIKNIQHCSHEKTLKVAAYRARYTSWWLLLVDFIAYGLEQFVQ